MNLKAKKNYKTKKRDCNGKNKLIVFNKNEIDILKNKNVTFEDIDQIKLFKNVFDCVVVSYIALTKK